jgi:dihydroorotase
MLDLLITNVLLPGTAGGGKLSHVGIREGHIEFCGSGTAPSASEVIDAGGNLLFPGFIDLHTHLFRHGSTFGMDADRLITSGVTCAVDMGSAGWVNFPAMHDCDLSGKQLPLKAFLNISPIGQPGKGISEPLDDALISEEGIAGILKEYPDRIAGLKVRISRGIVKDLGLRPLKRAVELGEEFGLPVCVHTTDPPETMDRLAAILRPGDVFSHTYHGQGHHSAENAAVLEGLAEEKRRGVLLEVGNGLKNFSFPVAEKCLAAGLTPDIISSDATPATFHKNPAMWDLPRVVSKFLNLGVPLDDCIRAVTETPAKVLGLENTGKIAQGFEADLALFRMDPEIISFCDSEGNERKGPRGLVPLMTILKGKIIWKDSIPLR